MIPILFCFPVFGSTPGFTCCVPSHLFLHILSIILLLILTPMLIINTLDMGEINVGFWAMNLFMFGTLLFIILGTLGVKKFSDILISASFAVWLLTYAGFLMVSIYSAWSGRTMEATSINGRCPMNLWLFKWCCLARGSVCLGDQGQSLTMFRAMQESFKLDTNLKLIERVNGKILDEHDLSYRFNADLEKRESNMVNTTFHMKNLIYIKNFTTFANSEISNWPKISAEYDYGEDQMFKMGNIRTNISESKKDLTDNKSVTALFGTLVIMMLVIGLYTLYAVTLNDILSVLRYPFPVIFITRLEQSEEGTASNEQRSPEIVLK